LIHDFDVRGKQPIIVITEMLVSNSSNPLVSSATHTSVLILIPHVLAFLLIILSLCFLDPMRG
jgi:hypothetical protein